MPELQKKLFNCSPCSGARLDSQSEPQIKKQVLKNDDQGLRHGQIWEQIEAEHKTWAEQMVASRSQTKLHNSEQTGAGADLPRKSDNN